MFGKLDLFPSSSEEKEKSTLLSLLERANFYQWTTNVIAVSSF
jgi:hypothetical protein